MPTLSLDLRAAAERLKAAGLEEPLREAHILARAAASPNEFENYLTRREKREPVAYILGRKEFWSLDFEVSPAVLIPRPDSETVIETALKLHKQNPPARILDLGTGSGCLLIALLTEWPQATGLGIDCSIAALEVARRNAHRLGVSSRAEFQEKDFAHPLDQKFNLIVTNPPYIRDEIVMNLDEDVRAFEPHLALRGGKDGLDAIRAIAETLISRLAPSARVLIEIGHDQAASASAVCESAGLRVEQVVKDLGGNERVLVGSAPGTVRV